MELSVRKSKIHMLLIALCFTLGPMVLWWSGVIVAAKYIFSLCLLLALAFELRAWINTPLSISLRGEKLYLHLPRGAAKLFQCAKAKPQFFWIGLRLNRYEPAIFLFRDSFSKSDWRALRRAVITAH